MQQFTDDEQAITEGLAASNSNLLQNVTSFLPSAGFSWMEQTDGAISDSGADPQGEDNPDDPSKPNHANTNSSHAHGNAGQSIPSPLRLGPSGGSSGSRGQPTTLAGTTFNGTMMVVPSIMVRPGMVVSMEGAGQDGSAMPQTVMLFSGGAVGTVHMTAPAPQAMQGSMLPPSPFEFASGPPTAAPPQTFSFDLTQGSRSQGGQGQGSASGAGAVLMAKTKLRLGNEPNSSGSSIHASEAVGGSPAGAADSDVDNSRSGGGNGHRTGTSVSAVAAQLLHKTKDKEDNRRNARAAMQQQQQEQHDVQQHQVLHLQQPQYHQLLQLQQQQQQQQQQQVLQLQGGMSPGDGSPGRQHLDLSFAGGITLVPARGGYPQDMGGRLASPALAQLQQQHQQQQHQQQQAQLQHQQQQAQLQHQQQQAQLQQQQHLMQQHHQHQQQQQQQPATPRSPSPPPPSNRAPLLSLSGQGLSPAPATGTPKMGGNVNAVWSRSVPVPEFHSYQEYEKRYGAALKCQRGECAVHIGRPCKEHRCACCKVGRQVQGFSRQGWCGPCGKREIVGGLTFVRCGRCKAEMLEATYQAHLKQNVSVSDAHGNKITGRCRDYPKEEVGTDKGRRCGKCTNLRPLTFYSSEDTNCSCNIHASRQPASDRASTPPVAPTVPAAAGAALMDAGAHAAEMQAGRVSPTNTGTTITKGMTGETGLARRISTAGTAGTRVSGGSANPAPLLSPIHITTPAIGACPTPHPPASAGTLLELCTMLSTGVSTLAPEVLNSLQGMSAAIALCVEVARGQARGGVLDGGGGQAAHLDVALNQLTTGSFKVQELAQRVEVLVNQLKTTARAGLALATQPQMLLQHPLPLPQLQITGVVGGTSQPGTPRSQQQQGLWPAPELPSPSHRVGASPFIVGATGRRISGMNGGTGNTPPPSPHARPSITTGLPIVIADPTPAARPDNTRPAALDSNTNTASGVMHRQVSSPNGLSMDLALLPSTVGPLLGAEPSLNAAFLGAVNSLGMGIGLTPQQQMLQQQLERASAQFENAGHKRMSGEAASPRPSKLQQVSYGIAVAAHVVESQAGCGGDQAPPSMMQVNHCSSGSGTEGHQAEVINGDGGSGEGAGSKADVEGDASGDQPGPAPQSTLGAGGFSEILLNIPSQLFT